MREDDEIRVSVVSMFGARTRQPLVVLTVGDAKPLTFTSDKAKEIGAMLIETAMASEADAFVHDWLRDRLGADEQQTGQILVEFRQWRQKRADRGGQ